MSAALSDAPFRALFAAAPDPILVADEEAHYLDANPAALELLGYTREELLRLRVPDVVAQSPDWTEAEYERFRREGQWRAEVELRRKDGTLVPMEAHATLVPLTTPPIYLSLLRDVSDRRDAERLRGEFTSMVTHELKNPLTAVKAYAELLKRDGAHREKAIEVILEQTNRLVRLIDDLADVSQLEAGRLELRPSAGDLTRLVSEAVTYALAMAADRKILVDGPGRAVPGSWDGDRIGQVLQNLLSNAIKYSPPDTTITIDLEPLEDEARVSVHNEGDCIPPGTLARLFDPFYRAAEAVEARAPGLGLGLYISKLLIEAHGGRIWVTSEEGAGTTVSFALPTSANTM
jgi:PAS domain S-box-containing protein